MFYWNFTNPTKSISLGALLINRLLGFGLFSLVALGFTLIYLFIYFIPYLFTYARSFYFHCYYRDFFFYFCLTLNLIQWFANEMCAAIFAYQFTQFISSPSPFLPSQSALQKGGNQCDWQWLIFFKFLIVFYIFCSFYSAVSPFLDMFFFFNKSFYFRFKCVQG